MLQRGVGEKGRDSRTRYIKVGGDFAVGQREPDEAQAHAESGWDVSKIVSFAWNTKWSGKVLVQKSDARTIMLKVCANAKTALGSRAKES